MELVLEYDFSYLPILMGIKTAKNKARYVYVCLCVCVCALVTKMRHHVLSFWIEVFTPWGLSIGNRHLTGPYAFCVSDWSVWYTKSSFPCLKVGQVWTIPASGHSMRFPQAFLWPYHSPYVLPVLSLLSSLLCRWLVLERTASQTLRSLVSTAESASQ